ncbi:MAG: glycosyltransferase [Planctomycetota bacterium]
MNSVVSRDQRIAVMLMASSMRGGGSEHQTALLLQHLNRERFEPHLFLLHRAGSGLDAVPEDVAIHSLPDGATEAAGWRLPGSALRRQSNAFWELARSASIDVIYDRTFHMTLIAGHPAARRTIPRVSTIVSPPHLALPSVERRFVGLKRLRLAKAYRDAYRVIAVSEAVKASALRYYRLPTEHVVTIRNPVDVDSLRSYQSKASEKNQDQKPQAEKSTRRLVCVGRMSEEKGQRQLIEGIIAMDRRWSQGEQPQASPRPKLEVRLLGDGPLRSELECRWQTYLLQSVRNSSSKIQVTFLGHVQPALHEIAASDALILPSHFEGMPNVVLEAMALGRSVIATRTGGTAEFQAAPAEPTCYWVPQSDPDGSGPEDFADAIENWLADEHGWTQRIANGDAVLRSNHALQTAISEIETQLVDASQSLR